jgi:hypothetical protein
MTGGSKTPTRSQLLALAKLVDGKNKKRSGSTSKSRSSVKRLPADARPKSKRQNSKYPTASSTGVKPSSLQALIEKQFYAPPKQMKATGRNKKKIRFGEGFKKALADAQYSARVIGRGIDATAKVVDKVAGVMAPVLDAAAIANPELAPLAVGVNEAGAVAHLIRHTLEEKGGKKRLVEMGPYAAPLAIKQMPHLIREQKLDLIEGVTPIPIEVD